MNIGYDFDKSDEHDLRLESTETFFKPADILLHIYNTFWSWNVLKDDNNNV